MQEKALVKAALEKRIVSLFAAGVAFALAGVALVETLSFVGLRPLTPVNWPAVGLFAAAAVGGGPSLAGAALTLCAYYLLNLATPERFPEFYGNPHSLGAWIVGVTMLVLAILAVRPRVLRTAAAEADLFALRRYESVLRESEARLRVVADNVPALVSYIDAAERYQFSNRAYEDWLEMPAAQMVGRTVREVWGEERYGALKPNIDRALAGERVTYEYTVNERGVERHVLASYVPDREPSGRVKGFFVLGSDITQLAAARRELHDAHDRLEAALDGSSVGLWDTDLRTGRVYLSDAWATMVGGPAGDTVATLEELIALVHPDDVEAVRRAAVEVVKGARPVYAVEHRVRARNGEWKWVLSRGRVTERDPASGRAVRVIGTNVDITDRKRIEEAIQSVAQTDPLTGLANRLLFIDRLRLALARARRSGTQTALLYLDLDRFKEVNDTLGHAAGDTLLKDFAMRLRSCVRAADTVARFGGDEFLVLLEDVKERDHALRVAEKIIEESRRPFALEGRDVSVTASIGLAMSDGDVAEEALVKRADEALYAAKAAGRDNYRIDEGPGQWRRR